MIGRQGRKFTTNTGAVSRTKQSFKDECDVNVVMRRFANNGQLPQTNPQTPTFGDFFNAPSYLDAQVHVLNAIADFEALPARVRKACNNDPAQFLTMVQDPDRKEELIELGLMERSVPPQLKAEPPEIPAPAADAPTLPAAPVQGGNEQPKA